MALSPESSVPLLAGVELGGTKCICILASGADDVRECIEIPTGEPSATISSIRTVLGRWQFAALGLASFGPLDLDRCSPSYGSLTGTPKRGWTSVSLLPVAHGFDAPLGIDTDVNGAALAEGIWGAAQHLKSWAYITVGTGIGVGSVVDGKPALGLGHSEAGHIRVPRHGDVWPGTCPFHGDCVEGLASGPAIEARAGMRADAIATDHRAWAFAADALAALCHALVYTVVPQRIVIGGGVALGQPQLLPMIRTRLLASLGGYSTAKLLERQIDRYLVAPGLGAMAGPLGAIAVAQSALASAGV